MLCPIRVYKMCVTRELVVTLREVINGKWICPFVSKEENENISNTYI